MSLDDMTGWLMATFLVSLRITPLLAFAPPFSLVRMPRIFLVLFGMALAAFAVPEAIYRDTAHAIGPSGFIVAAATELMLGITLMLPFQISFAALYFVGRTIDIQSGFALALLIDPTTRAQTPLVGTLFAYAAAAVFFGMDGHHETFGLLCRSVELVRPGQWLFPDTIAPVAAFMSSAFLIALGVGGATILSLFLADLGIALLSRTVPQMNVLILGFQLKTMLVLLTLPVSFGVGSVALVRLMRMSIDEIPGLF